jgi:hypothetical protein
MMMNFLKNWLVEREASLENYSIKNKNKHRKTGRIGKE